MLFYLFIGRLQSLSYVLNIPFLLKNSVWGSVIINGGGGSVTSTQSMFWSRGKACGLLGEGIPLEGLKVEAIVAAVCQEGDWRASAQLCLSRDWRPAHFAQAQAWSVLPTGTACLISSSWAAFVALPNFWTLFASVTILNYLSNLPFNKFILKCLDWSLRKNNWESSI